MEKQEIIEYLQNEFKDLKKEYDNATKEYQNAQNGFENKIATALRLEKAQDKYFYFHMICNDLGII